MFLIKLLLSVLDLLSFLELRLLEILKSSLLDDLLFNVDILLLLFYLLDILSSFEIFLLSLSSA
jgi:hypothetical protein